LSGPKDRMTANPFAKEPTKLEVSTPINQTFEFVRNMNIIL